MFMEDRVRMARAIARADHKELDGYEKATPSEQYHYDCLALAALDARHVYAVHTVSSPAVFHALAKVDGDLTVTRAGDQYEEWGEDAEAGDPQHVVIGTSDYQVAEDIVRALNAHDLPADVTEHEDHALQAYLGIDPVKTWGLWMRETGRLG